MAVSQRTIVLNDFGLVRHERTTSTGTTARRAVTIDATPLVHVFDAKILGAGPAQAIAEHLRERIGAISAPAAEATILRRKAAALALSRGASWAQRRYSGGRTGATPPEPAADKLFNDSGRLRNGIVAGPTRDNQWQINVPANRFDPSTFTGGESALIAMYNRLREYVPELGDANRLAIVPAVRQAIGESIDAIYVGRLGRSYGGSSDMRSRVRGLDLEAIKRGYELISMLAG